MEFVDNVGLVKRIEKAKVCNHTVPINNVKLKKICHAVHAENEEDIDASGKPADDSRSYQHWIAKGDLVTCVNVIHRVQKKAQRWR